MPLDDPHTPRGGRAGGGRRLRIGVEAHVVNSHPSGNGRVVANLVRALADGSDHEFIAYVTDPRVAAAWGRDPPPRTTIRRVRAGRNPLIRIPFALPALAWRDRLDVFLAHDVRPPVSPCPVVTLVHDVAFERHPEFFSFAQRQWMPRAFGYSCRHSAGVITVSRFTRDEIVDVFGVSPDRIVVAHNGVDPAFLDPSPRPSPFGPPFILAAGNLQPRKNLVTLIRAFRSMKRRSPDLPERLIVVGQPGYGAASIVTEADDLTADGSLVFTGFLDTEALIGLMQRATAFAYPSIYEGFGLPPLEAMAVGTPTLASDIPAAREVLGDAAVLIAPMDVEAWSAGLERFARDPAARVATHDIGRARAAGFTWDRAAAEALTALVRAAG